STYICTLSLHDALPIYIMADAHFLPFIDKAFSHVRCWHVLEHISNPAKAIEEIHRVGETGNIRFPLDDGYKRETLRAILALSPRSEEHTSELQSPCNLV